MAKTVEQLRIAAQEALEKARRYEEQAQEAEARAVEEAAIAEANRVLVDGIRQALSDLLASNPLPDADPWTITAKVETTGLTVSLTKGNGKNGHKTGGNGNGKGSQGNAFARPAYSIPEGYGLYIVDGEGNIVPANNLDAGCDKLELAHWCKSGAMPKKGDTPGRVLYKFAGENPDRVFTKAITN